MSPALRALATALRASGKLRWYPGMLTTHYGRVLLYTEQPRRGLDCFREMRSWPTVTPVIGWDEPPPPVPADALPDFDDLLTQLALLPMTREAYSDPYLRTEYWADPDGAGGRWFVLRAAPRELKGLAALSYSMVASEPTELEALLAALLAAPGGHMRCLEAPSDSMPPEKS